MANNIITTTKLDTDFDKFLGQYIVEPGQFQHLDNQNVVLTRKELRIVIETSTFDVHTFMYSISRIRFIQDPSNLKRANAVALTITNSSVIHSDGGQTTNSHHMEQLLNDILDIRTPTVLYMTYNPDSGFYTLKNNNYATIAILDRID